MHINHSHLFERDRSHHEPGTVGRPRGTLGGTPFSAGVPRDLEGPAVPLCSAGPRNNATVTRAAVVMRGHGQSFPRLTSDFARHARHVPWRATCCAACTPQPPLARQEPKHG